MIYLLYLNGELYGSGSLKHVNNLIKDYIVVSELYGHSSVTFTVIRGNIIDKKA